jgi:hypothetical protein
VCVAVDPSGGGGSNFAICSIATDIKTGHTVVRTCGSQLFKLPSQTLSNPLAFTSYASTTTRRVRSLRFHARTWTLLAI